MPVTAPVLQGHDVKGFFIPSLEVGGDYYDYHVRYDKAGNPESLFLALVDVSGKAMKAAMQAVFTSGLILSRLDSDSPETILKAINPILKDKTDNKTFITCLIGELNLVTNNLRLSNAGHCQPILKRGGKASFIKTPGPRFPLGFKSHVEYTSLDIPLKSGDVLIMYSDGLPEAKNNKNEEFGFDQTLGYVTQMATDRMSSTEICLNIKKMIQQYSNYSMRDDTTVVCLKVR
jgi:serine phosphatase RsbU (regulator of sigma subunit)